MLETGMKLEKIVALVPMRHDSNRAGRITAPCVETTLRAHY